MQVKNNILKMIERGHPDAQESYDYLVNFNAEALRDILADLEEEED